MTTFQTHSKATSTEVENRVKMAELLQNSPIPKDELPLNLGLYQSRLAISRILYINELYQKIINTHGVILEFGVRWGQSISLYTALRGIYEPYNYSREVIGFDTFGGFPSVDAKDGAVVNEGDFGTTKGYEEHLAAVLDIHETTCPISQVKKYKLVKGDAVETFGNYLTENPHTVVALAYFDFDIYSPTRACLDMVIPRMAKGGILAFDELACRQYPGETLALMETLGLSRYKLQRNPAMPFCSYMVIE